MRQVGSPLGFGLPAVQAQPVGLAGCPGSACQAACCPGSACQAACCPGSACIQPPAAACLFAASCLTAASVIVMCLLIHTLCPPARCISLALSHQFVFCDVRIDCFCRPPSSSRSAPPAASSLWRCWCRRGRRSRGELVSGERACLCGVWTHACVDYGRMQDTLDAACTLLFCAGMRRKAAATSPAPCLPRTTSGFASTTRAFAWTIRVSACCWLLAIAICCSNSAAGGSASTTRALAW